MHTKILVVTLKNILIHKTIIKEKIPLPVVKKQKKMIGLTKDVKFGKVITKFG